MTMRPVNHRGARATAIRAAAYLAVAAACVGCQPNPVKAESPTASAPAPAIESHSKAQAPVSLTLVTSGAAGEIDVVLTVTADADLAAGQARLVLPAALSVVSGSTETTFETVAKGQQTTVKARILVPAGGPYTLAGGVEINAGTGRQLAKSTTVVVGTQTTPATTHEVRKLPEGESVRIGR